jgi:CheY-like chemotaxis protein
MKVLKRVATYAEMKVVDNGVAVLAALEQQPYDIIFMDIHMPEMDGLEASRRIRLRYGPDDRPRIVALSADTLQVGALRGLAPACFFVWTGGGGGGRKLRWLSSLPVGACKACRWLQSDAFRDAHDCHPGGACTVSVRGVPSGHGGAAC